MNTKKYMVDTGCAYPIMGTAYGSEYVESYTWDSCNTDYFDTIKEARKHGQQFLDFKFDMYKIWKLIDGDYELIEEKVKENGKTQEEWEN